jgi:hypothetical protein
VLIWVAGMAERPTPPARGGAYSAFSETELVDYAPLPGQAFYDARRGCWIGRDGVVVQLPKRPESSPTEPVQPSAIAEDNTVPSPEEPTPDVWAGPKPPPKRVAIAAQLLMEVLADRVMFDLLFPGEFPEGLKILNAALPRIVSLGGHSEEAPREAGVVAVQPTSVDDNERARIAVDAAVQLVDPPPLWLVKGLLKTMCGRWRTRDDAPSPAEVERRLADFIRATHRLKDAPVSPEVRAALDDIIVWAERATPVNHRLDNREFAVFVVTKAAMVISQVLGTPVGQDLPIRRAATLYLRAVGVEPEKRPGSGQKAEVEDDLEEDDAIPNYDVRHIREEESIWGVRYRWGIYESPGDERPIKTSKDCHKTPKEAVNAGRIEAEQMRQEAIKARGARLQLRTQNAEAGWAKHYVKPARERALGPEGDAILKIFIEAGMPVIGKTSASEKR